MTLPLVDDLKQDHARLCGELAVLKAAESGETDFLAQTMRDVCARLSTGLNEHMLREERIPALHGRSLGAAASPSMDHYNDFRYLQVITRYITSEKRPFLLCNRYQLLKSFVGGLKRHIEEQEAGWNR